MRQLLLFSYHFPPSNEVAGKPTARLVRYMRTFGWDVTVVTSGADDERAVRDDVGYSDVLAKSKIIRVNRGWWPLDSVSLASKLIRRIAPKSVEAGPHRSRPTDASSITGRLKKTVLRWSGFPDAQSGWIFPAYRRATRLLNEQKYDALMTVSPPASSHLLGLLLGRQVSIPWVAQFHDPWVENAPFASLPFPLIQLTRQLESQVIRRADLVLSATPRSTDRFRCRYVDECGSKFQTLYNGFDAADFPTWARTPSIERSKLRIIHTGSLYAGRDPFPFLRALAALRREGEVTPENIGVRFIGDCATAVGKSVVDVVAELGIDDIVTLEPPVPYPVALAAMSESDVLLLFAQDQPDQIPAKLFEYLYLGRYVLAFTSGASQQLIDEMQMGCVLTQDDTEIKAAIRKLIRSHADNDLQRDTVGRDIGRYEARNLAEDFAMQLNKLLSSRQRLLNGAAAAVADPAKR